MMSSRAITMKNWVPRDEKKSRARKVRKKQHGNTSSKRHYIFLRVLFGMVLLLGVLFGLFTLSNWLGNKRVSLFAVEAVKIGGNLKEYQAKEVEALLMPYLQGDFFKVDLSSAKLAIMSISWVRDVEIQRQWPNTVWLEIETQTPVAYWNDEAYVNDVAQVYQVDMAEDSLRLPKLFGPQGTEAVVMRQYGRFSSLLQSSDILITELEWDERGSWKIIFDNGIEVMLGSKEVFAHLSRFMHAYDAYFASMKNLIKSVDLRYSNGLAVSWKSTHQSDASTRL